MMNGQFNNAYDDTNDVGVGTKTQDDRIDLQTFSSQYGATNQSIKEKDDEQERQKWGSPVEFLLSCIAMSVCIMFTGRYLYTFIDLNFCITLQDCPYSSFFVQVFRIKRFKNCLSDL